MASFHQQLRQALPDLWRYAFALTRNREQADDLVQDCAERALRKRLLWMPGRPLKPWLMTMLLNIFRNQYAQAQKENLVPYDEGRAEAAVMADAEDRLELSATLRAMECLPPEQREALLAVVIGGLDYAQAARALGIAPGTLMSRISRARKKMRQFRDGPDVEPVRSVP